MDPTNLTTNLEFLLVKVSLLSADLRKKTEALAKHAKAPDDCLILSPAPWNITDRKLEEFLRKKQWKVFLTDTVEGKVLADFCLD